MDLRLPKNTLLVAISETERDEIFKHKFKLADGKELFLVKEIEADFGEDKWFSQTVNIGTVIKVSDDITNYKVDDVVLFDNLVDTNPNNVVEYTDEGKVVVLLANNTFHEDELYTPPSGMSKGGYAYREGDRDELTNVICIFREGKFLCVGDRIICHNTPVKNDTSITRIIYKRHHKNQPDLVIRRILVAPEKSEYKHGDMVLVNDELVATFDMGGKLFDYFEEEDVLLHKSVSK